jgi:hypothetical protein
MSENIRSFRDLRVWQKAMDLAMDVYGETKRFPTHERFSLENGDCPAASSTQLLRGTVPCFPGEGTSLKMGSVPIIRAWRKRRYPAAFVSKLNDAEGEAAETQSHLEVCVRCGYVDASSAKRLDDAYEGVLSMLVKMASHPEKWRIRESKRHGDTETR